MRVRSVIVEVEMKTDANVAELRRFYKTPKEFESGNSVCPGEVRVNVIRDTKGPNVKVTRRKR